MVNVLFVCTGNICRSPMAEGVFGALAERAGLAQSVRIDSAGTTGYHTGESPDARAREAAMRRGIDLGRQRARQVRREDFQDFDYIIAMDRENHDRLHRDCPASARHRVRLFLDFAADRGNGDIPDPYYGGDGGFDHALDLIEAAADGLITHIIRNDPKK